MSTKSKRDYNEEEGEVEVTSNSISLCQSPAWYDFVLKVMSMETDIDIDELTSEFGDELVKKRKGDYGKMLSYIPAKYIRERLNTVLDCKWSFFPILEQRVVDPIEVYDKKKDEYYDAPKYIKILGVLVIPGLGVQTQYGVKKTYGSGEANDWKAATTDAFKKCCAAFGIEADYDIDDDGEDEEKKPIILEDVEYSEEELEDALEVTITFGKYKDLTLEDILDEDPAYLEWLVENARDKDVRESTAIVLKNNSDKEESHSAKKRRTTSKSSSKRKTSSKSTSKTSSTKKRKELEEDDDDKEELIEQIKEIFEDSDEYDVVTKKELIKSISTSKANPNGKRKLVDLSLKELKALATVLLDDDDEDEDDE